MLGVGGFFRNRIKYLKAKHDELDSPDVDQVSTQLAVLQMSPENDLQFLKSCVIKNTDQAVVIAKLKSTQKLREAMLRDTNIDLRESFPFLFSNPDLVNFFSCLSILWLTATFVSLNLIHFIEKIDRIGFRSQYKLHMR